MVITISCPSCQASFPVDPDKIPAGGVRVRCSACAHVFRVEKPEPEVAVVPEPEVAAPEAGTTPEAEAPVPDAGSTPEPEATVPGQEAEAAEWEPERAQDETSGESESFDPADDAYTEPAGEPFADASHDLVAEPAADPAVDALPELATESAEEPTGDVLPGPTGESAEDTIFPEPAADEPSAAPVQGFTFGRRDPTDKARRLARVLVSDMIMYNAERHQVALAQGTLAEDFEEEIDKSWKEYVDQVGPGMAEGEGRGFWVQALNDILAKGRDVF